MILNESLQSYLIAIKHTKNLCKKLQIGKSCRGSVSLMSRLDAALSHCWKQSLCVSDWEIRLPIHYEVPPNPDTLQQHLGGVALPPEFAKVCRKPPCSECHLESSVVSYQVVFKVALKFDSGVTH